MMKRGLGMDNEAIHQVFAKWNEGVLDSYLVEITRDILAFQDDEDIDGYTLDVGRRAAADPDRRSRVRPLPVRVERRTRRRQQDS